MAENDHLLTFEANTVVRCPRCKQKYLLQGFVMRDGQLMACSVCNTLFTIHRDGRKIETRATVEYDSTPFGPAEGPTRQ